MLLRLLGVMGVKLVMEIIALGGDLGVKAPREWLPLVVCNMVN